MASSGRLGTDRQEPVAAPEPYRKEVHGVAWDDAWHWLRDPAYPEVRKPEVLAYLEAENAYFEAVMAPEAERVEALYWEVRGRQKESDAAVPWQEGGWFYQWRFEAGEEYRRWFRWPLTGGNEELILDEPALAEGFDYFRLGGWAVERSGRYLAWSADNDGSERFTIRVKDLRSGEALADVIPNSLGSPLWAADGCSFLYLVLSDSWRPYQVRLHTLGAPVADDPVLYEESDDSFFVGIGETQSRAYLVISAGDHVTSELRLLPADAPRSQPTLVAARETNHEYDLDHAHGRVWIRTNDHHRNFRLVSAPEADPTRAQWREEIAGSDRDYLCGHTAFARFVALEERVDGLDQLRLRGYDGHDDWIEFPEPTYSASLGMNAEFEIDRLRIGYTSMVTPDTVFDYDPATGTLETRKVREIPSGYDPSRYRSERRRVTARDGTEVPVSLVYRNDFVADGSAPLYLTAYGAYGMALPPAFSAARLSLLERGFACAIAHVRGGDDLGYHWYEAGKLDRRQNTFNDFEDVARGLIDAGFARPGRIAISGGSAGGELMGAVMNQAPELWGTVVAHVPFVDVLNTMLDASLPLTPIEWPEWGNPVESPAAFANIRSYSPYDNVVAQRYPALMVTAGLNDPRVTYWEPAKWMARLRSLRTDDNVMVLKTNMGAGHGGRSGRWESLWEVAEAFAFILAGLASER